MQATVAGSVANAGLAGGLSAGGVAGWIASACLAWLLGVGLQFLQTDLDQFDVYRSALLIATAGLVAAFMFSIIQRGARNGRAAATVWFVVAIVSCCFFALAAWSTTGMQASSRMAQRLPTELEGIDLLVTGVVSDLPQKAPGGLRFVFTPETALTAGRPVQLPPRLSLGWYAQRADAAVLSEAQRSLRAGQRWQMTLRLRRPHGNLNPHGFDYELHLFERDVGATGYVREGQQAPIKLSDDAGFHLARLRQSVRDSIVRQVADPRAAGVLAALAVGDQSAIDQDDWQLFRDTGISHLVAISGLHVTMFSWLAAGLIGSVWRRSERASLWLAAPHAGRWGGLAAAGAYAAFAGWGVPAQRTLAMLALVVLLSSMGRRWPWPMILFAAAMLVTWIDPWALLQPGFWLSFVAVGLLLAAEAAHDAPQPAPPDRRLLYAAWALGSSRLWQMLRSQAAVSVGLAPLSLIFFQQVSLVGLLANLLAIPLVTLVITPLALLGIGFAWLWQPAAWLLQLMSSLLAWLAGWPLAVWTVAAAGVWVQLTAMLGALLAVLPLPWRVRLLVVPLALPLLMPARTWPAQGRFEAIAIDVGQGTSVLIRTRSHLLLYDTGPRYSSESDAGQRALLPLLRGRGENRIDMMLLSHRDSDHVGGAASVINAMPVGELLDSLEDDHPLRQLTVARRRCLAGLRWVWDGVSFEIVHPLLADYAGIPKPNAISCVLRIVGSAEGSGSLLVTGDIERLQELALVGREAGGLRSTVMIAPHHGSRTSSTTQLLEAVQPQLVVFQAGYRNRFGHPALDVVERYRSRGIAIVDSARCGAWSWQGDMAAGQWVCERERRRRYWHDRMPPFPPAGRE